MNKKYKNSKIFTSFFILLLSIGINGCAKNPVQVDNLEVITYETNMNESYEYDMDLEIDMNRPEAFVEFNGIVYVADTGNDRILMFDKEKQILRVIGETGNEQGKFVRPTAIGVNENKLVVGDTGNGRIQLFSLEGEFIDQVIVGDFQDNMFNTFKSLVIDSDDNIYASIESSEKKDLGIIYINKEKEVEKIVDGLWGDLVTINGTIFLVAEGEFVEKEKSLTSEKAIVYRINEQMQVVPVVQLPSQYSPRTTQIFKENIYIYSHGYATIDKFDLNWNYLETMHTESFSNTTGWQDLLIRDNGDIWILDSANNKIHIYKYSN